VAIAGCAGNELTQFQAESLNVVWWRLAAGQQGSVCAEGCCNAAYQGLACAVAAVSALIMCRT
jgi:hypothetical protein